MVYLYLITYNILLLASLLVSLPFIWRKVKPDKNFPGDWRERIAVYNSGLLTKLKRQKNLWIHTVSIGEFLSVTPLIERLQKERDESTVITLATKTGRKVAETKISDIIPLFFPLDFYPVMKKAFKEINPKAIIIIETELWPSLLKIANQRNIPVILLNGRLSPFSYPKYEKVRFFSKRLLPLFSAITMRTEEEADKIIRLGADPKRVEVVGSMKFDLAREMSKSINPQKVKDSLQLNGKRIVVFGSLHPEEEAPIVDIASRIMNRFKDIRVVIVPRYLDKTGIYKILRQRRISFTKRSDLPVARPCNLIVVDTYGELNNFYSISELAFVGASLYKWGGQNPIEPTAFKKPVLFGIHNWHFKEEWQKIKEGRGGIEVESYDRLYRETIRLLENPELSREIGKNGYQVLLENTGATEKNLQIVSRFL